MNGSAMEMMNLFEIHFGVENPFHGLEEPPSRGSLARATLGGKYNYIVAVFELSSPLEPDLIDLGWQNQENFMELSGLPDGYYVWVDPFLICFGYSPEEPNQISSALEHLDYTEKQLKKASHGGKYQELLHVIFAPKDLEIYGEELEYGYRE
ncbi:MAG: hypothetical protein D6785_11940, partial [Planctomycetota bacterium]